MTTGGTLPIVKMGAFPLIGSTVAVLVLDIAEDDFGCIYVHCSSLEESEDKWKEV